MKQILVILFILSSFFFSTAQANENIAQDETVKKAVVSGDFSKLKQKNPQIIKRIITPSTLLMDNGLIIELYGIDIPGVSGTPPSSLAIKTKTYMDEWLSRKKVNLYLPNNSSLTKNAYGHNKAQLETYDQKNWIQGVLISEGLARAYPLPNSPDISAQMYKLEENARTEKKGLWANASYSVLNGEQAQEHLGSFQIVEGTIKSVAVLNNFIYLKFEKGPRSVFKIKIIPTARRAFLKKSINPMQLSGKKVRVRGYIEGPDPTITVNHPIFLELLSDQT
jgi:endonuclease YncB( thermonuclease family)